MLKLNFINKFLLAIVKAIQIQLLLKLNYYSRY
nr:MAG TPA: hypothetical protein [Caudoviricetes sp.]